MCQSKQDGGRRCMTHMSEHVAPGLGSLYRELRHERRRSLAAGGLTSGYTTAAQTLLTQVGTLQHDGKITAPVASAYTASILAEVSEAEVDVQRYSHKHAKTPIPDNLTQQKAQRRAVKHVVRGALQDALHGTHPATANSNPGPHPTPPKPPTTPPPPPPLQQAAAANLLPTGHGYQPAPTSDALTTVDVGYDCTGCGKHAGLTPTGTPGQVGCGCGAHLTLPDANAALPAEYAAVPHASTADAAHLTPGARHTVVTSTGTRLTVKDKRGPGATPLRLNPHAMAAAANAAGVHGGHVDVLLVDQAGGGYGYAQTTGPNAHRVVVQVKPKPSYSPGAAYVLNNSLVHELRHVSQQQADPQMSVKYSQANSTVGYQDNPYEVEARYYGRVADHTGAKDTGPAGTAVAGHVWAILPGST